MNGPPDERSNDARSLRRERAQERSERTESRRLAGRDAKWRRTLRTLRRASLKRLVHFLGPWLLRGLRRTWRVQRIDAHHFDDALAQGPCVISLWHGTMLPMAPIHRGTGVAILVSPSGDGDVVVGILKGLGYRIVRGSISKRGSRAMREMRDLLREGTAVCITPDGPRGPRHSMNVGPAWLAREVGCPWVTLCVDAAPAWRLRSWDRFLIPKPRSRVRITYLEPVRIPASTTDLELEAIAATQREALIETSTESNRILCSSTTFPESEDPAPSVLRKRHQN